MNINNIKYTPIENNNFLFKLLVIILSIVLLSGLGATYYMEHLGHYISGMNNRIVWGLPHVFAIFLILAASGALNIASISSVFNNKFYKPLARLSTVLAITLLIGGLMILVLDLGRPDRLIIAMTTYNFKSIFAWNIILYNGFIVLSLIYLWVMIQNSLQKYTKTIGIVAFIWRIILTSGTGSIFGFLVARQAYDAIIMAPMFIAMSFAFGLAFYILILMLSCRISGRELGSTIKNKLGNLLAMFIAIIFYFVLVYHIGNLYAAEHANFQRFILFADNYYNNLFWYGHILFGIIAPLALIYFPKTRNRDITLILSSILTIFGGLIALYIIIIGGQAYPLEIFNNKEIISGYSGIIIYIPTIYEFLLGLSGVAVSILALILIVKILPILPQTLDNKLFN